MAKRGYNDKGRSQKHRPKQENDYPRKEIRQDLERDVSNDPNWYAQEPQLLQDAASISYANITGLPFDPFEGGSYRPTPGYYRQAAVPGIMSIYLTLTPGISTSDASNLNIAARNIYSFVRHVNSGSRNYDSPDLFLYYMCMDSIYALYSHCMRAYGVSMVYNSRNRYYCEALLQAMGFEPKSLLNNLADFRAKLNQMCVKIGSMCVPSSMPYMVRHSWCFTNVYSDSVDPKAQMYIYVPHRIFQYEENEGAGYGKAVTVCNPNSSRPASEFLDLLEDCIERIMSSEDCGIMSGDTLKAFGDSVIRLTSVPESYGVIAQYNEEVLGQIENLTLEYMVGDMNITQDPTAPIGHRELVYNPKFNTFGSPTWNGGQILNSRHYPVAPAETMVNTRLTAARGNYLNTDAQTFAYEPADYRCRALGSEVVTYINIFYYKNNTSGSPDLVFFPVDQHYYVDSYAMMDTEFLAGRIGLISQFDWHPAIYFNGRESEFRTQTYNVSFLKDVDNWTVIQPETLEKMHNTALLSLFNVPAMGRWSSKVTG